MLSKWRSLDLYAGILGLASLALHAIPFILFSRNPLGYDTGFYRRYLIEPFLSFPGSPVPGLGNDAWGPRILLDILRLAHMPTDIALYGSYLILYAFLPVIVFFFLRRSIGERGAFLAGLFVLSSSVAYEAYWFMLYKNIFALDVMFLAFIALERKRTYAAYVLSIILSLSHATSAIVYLLTLVALFIFQRERRRETAINLSLTAVTFLAMHVALLQGASVALPTALFIEWPQFIWLSLPYVLILIASWHVPFEKPVPRTLLAFTGISLLYPILHLPFYERIFVYADIGLSVLSAYIVFSLTAHWSKIGLTGFEYIRAAILCVSLGLLLGNLFDQINSLRPLVSEGSISRIEAIGAVVPQDALILTSANEAPWYEGWTTAHIAAPGLLHDTHNLEKWQALWDATSTDYRIQFLNSFAAPLYVSTLGSYNDLLGAVPPCLTQAAPDILYDACGH